MGLATANGIDVIDVRIVVPRVGVWTADLVVDDPDALTGPCAIATDGGLTFKGTVMRGGVWIDTSYVRVVAGGAGLGKTARPKHYRNVSGAVIMRDLLAAAGEKLAPSSDAALLQTQYVAYTQAALPVGPSVSALLSDRRLNAPSWRALADGTIWVGREAWPDAGIIEPEDFQTLAELPHEGRAEIGIETPRTAAGAKLDGRRVSAIEYRLRDGETRMRVLYEDG